MGRLPRSLDELRSLRAARWIRESSAGQYDRFGPDSQHRQVDDFLEHYGLVDSGLVWTVAQSGRTVWRSEEMMAMLAAARAGEFDVLLTGYFDRWQRNLRRTLELVEDGLHPAGVAWVMCDRRLVSSDRRDWDQMITEAHEAERYSRRLGERIADGYTAKRAARRDPGGRPPFGFRRNAESKLVEPDPASYATACKVFELAADRLTDREVAAATGLPLFTVRGMLTSPLYAGRLRTGELAHWPPLVSPATWEAVQAIRARRRTRDGRPPRRRSYALTMLHCAHCGRHLIGDTGRYRHPDPCERFAAAHHEPRRRQRGQRRAMPGHSYRAEQYEDLVREVLGRVELGAALVADVVGITRDPEPDRLALHRIGQAREAALRRYRADRDTRALEAAMASLDRQEAAALAPVEVPALAPAEVAAYLRDLPRLWDDAPDSRRGLAEALFERIEVSGLRRMHLEPTPAAVAHGLVEAFHSGSAGYGRGERIWRSGSRLIVQREGNRTALTVGGVRLPPLREVRSA